MFTPLALNIGFRYTRSKRSNTYISFMSFSSMLGIALGVAVLITVLSVMNGFDEQLHKEYFSMAPQVMVTNYDSRMDDWQTLQTLLAKQADVTVVAPYINTQTLAAYNGANYPMQLNAINAHDEKRLSVLADKMEIGRLDDLKAGQYNIILGRKLAMRLGVLTGDKITVMIAKANVNIMGVQPRFKRFTVSGIFSAGNGFGFDNNLGFVALADAQKLLQTNNDVSGLRLRLHDPLSAPQVTQNLRETLGDRYLVSDWTQLNGAFFSAVKMEKTMMFLILLLIVAVAAFNLVSSLVMVVNDKRADIAILRTLGATPRTILTIFLVQGATVALIGTLLGTALGIVLALNATELVNWLQASLGVKWMNANVYFIDYLPSRLQWHDVMVVVATALGLSFLASLFPAWQASRVQPAEALRYE